MADDTTQTATETPSQPSGDELTPDELEQKNKLGYSMEDDERETVETENEEEEEAEKGHS
jgi:hypothetical protein